MFLFSIAAYPARSGIDRERGPLCPPAGLCGLTRQSRLSAGGGSLNPARLEIRDRLQAIEDELTEAGYDELMVICSARQRW